jgi:NitT/TauT family transport system substrate-binding protein
MGPRPGRKRLAVSPKEVDQWFEQLREAADAEMPSDISREHKARLLLELVGAMHRMDPAAVARQLEREAARADTQEISGLPATGERVQASRSGSRPASPRHALPSRRDLRRSSQPRWMGRLRHVPRSIQVSIVMGLVLVLTATGVLLAQPRPGTEAAGGLLGGGTKVKVGVLPVVDVAPFYRALEAGYFAQEGLLVEPVATNSGPEAIEQLSQGKLDIAFTSYPGVLAAQAEQRADFKIVAPAYTALPGHLMLVAPPNGRITKAEDVAGKRIAVTSTGSISDLGAMSELSSRSVDLATIKWVQMPFSEMSSAMQSGDVDGAVLAEPYITLTDNAFHARPILDVAIGRTARIPVSGWATRNQAGSNADAAAAFVRALRRGVDEVMADRAKLDPILMHYLKLDAKTARSVRIAEYTKELDAREIQRVADLMKEFDAIQKPLNVLPMLLTS